MTTDFENELRDLFREKAGEAPLATPSMPASAPRQVLRRGRLHQAGTVIGSAVVVVALIVGSVAGLTRILGEGNEDNVGNGDYEVFQRTATVEAFTVGSPSDWYLVNQWPLSMLIAVEGSSGSSSKCVAVPSGEPVECDDTPDVETASPIPLPHGLPMFQLSNVDLGLATNACADGLPAGAAVLHVALDASPEVGGDSPPIQEFPPGEPGLPPTIEDGPCGPGRYAHFKVNGEPFFAWIGIGAGVTDADRETVETSYEMMSAIPDWELSPPNETTPAYVIAGGSSEAGEGWRLELRPGEPNPVMTLDRAAGDAVSAPLDDVLSGSSYEPELTDPIFGAIARAATGVEFRPGTENLIYDLGQSPVAGMIVPIPPTMGGFDFDLFVIDPPEGYADHGGHVIALGAEMPSEGPPRVGAPRADEVELGGDAFGLRYRVRFVGSFADDTACIRVMVDGEGTEPLCPRPVATSLAGDQPSVHVVNTADLAVVVGSVPPEVVEIRFTSDSGNTTPSQSQCRMGPIGWTDPDRRVCAIALPPQDGGTFEYLGSDGDVLFEDGMAWFVSQGEPVAPMPVDPVHGGTYWAVYPWVGAAGDREADDVSAELFAQFGIEAFPGDLACDQGAAEALGTDAEQGIGVYFETDDEANAFALQAGLLDHTRRVIARVTTYCLD
jgi:hypothetical protein